MTFSEYLAKLDKNFRPVITQLPGFFSVIFYSYARKWFLSSFSNERRPKNYTPPKEFRSILWDLEFNSNIFNAAGMFKKGESYYTVASQGAGAYLAGTTTHLPRKGNIKAAVMHPFAPYPGSKTASNWMGLPNPGHAFVAKKLSKIEKIKGCPLGASISLSPEEKGDDALKGAVIGMKLYQRAGVDFIELNESCPNVPHDYDSQGANLDEELIKHLEYINTHFLKYRDKNLPLIVKFSTDTSLELLPALIDTLVNLGFDGINLGNTSTDYINAAKFIAKKEKRIFSYFTKTFGGGISGQPLKSKSLSLAAEAVNYIRDKNLQREFHVIRTGGIESLDDLNISTEAGIQMNQWFTGYFDAFSNDGHKVYERMFEAVEA